MTTINRADLALVDHIADQHADEEAIWAELEAEEQRGAATHTLAEIIAQNHAARTGTPAVPGESLHDRQLRERLGQRVAYAPHEVTPEMRDRYARGELTPPAAPGDPEDGRFFAALDARRSSPAPDPEAERRRQELLAEAWQIAQSGSQAEAAAFLKSPEWGSFQDEYPEIAEPIGAVISRLESTVATLARDREQRQIAAQEAALAEQHPDWEEQVADPAFVRWLDGQPAHVREAALRNANAIVDATQAADVVGRFKAARGASGRQASKRQRQLEAARTVRGRGAGVTPSATEDDEAAIWGGSRARGAVMTPAQRETVLRRLAEGDTLRALCRDERTRDPTFPAEATVRLAVRRDGAFAIAYEQARLLGYERLADEILEIADDASDDWVETENGRVLNRENVARARLQFDARRWLLSKCLPKIYGDHLEVRGSVDHNIRAMSDEELRQAIVDELNRLQRLAQIRALEPPAPAEIIDVG